MKKYLVAALTVVLLILGTNAWVDPASISGSGRELTIANILLSGQNASVPRSQIDFEERRLLREVALGMPQRPSTLAFGSSRFRYVTREYLDEPTFFNHSINAATLEDLYTLYWYYKERDLTPDRMLIALDPWMIDRDVSYIHLINLAYADDFVRAVKSLGLQFTANDQAAFASAIAQGNRNLDTAVYPLTVPDASVISPTGETGKYEVTSFNIPESGNYELTFDARITSGSYYYNIEVVSDISGVVLSGGYLGPLANNQTPSVHEFRTFVLPDLKGQEGERISVIMQSATGDGAAAPGAGQNFQIRDLRLLRACNDEIDLFSLFNAICISTRIKREVDKLGWIRELFSPAYFQQSVGLIGQRLLAAMPGDAVADQISPIEECVAAGAYTWCADGSVSPPETRNSVEAILNIVQTIDDGIVSMVTPDPEQLQNLEKFIAILRADGVEVTFFLVPIHPFTYDKWRSAGDQKGFERAELIYEEFARKNGVPIFGTYDPAGLQMGNDCFRDWVHPFPECLERVLELADL